MSSQLIVPPCRNYWCRSTNKYCITPFVVEESLWTESPIQTTGLRRTKVIYLWIYILSWVLTNFSYKLLWTIMDTLWTVVITQSQQSQWIDVGDHFTVIMIKLPNVISRIPIIHLLPIYFCTNSSWNVKAAICPEGRLSSLALSSVYNPTVEDGNSSTPMVPAQLSVPLQ